MVGIIENEKVAAIALATDPADIVAVGDREVLRVLGNGDQVGVAGGDERLIFQLRIGDRLQQHAWLLTAPRKLFMRNPVDVDVAGEHIDISRRPAECGHGGSLPPLDIPPAFSEKPSRVR